MKDRWITIVNPAAGGGRCGERSVKAIAELRAAGLELDVYRTTKAGDATAIAREQSAKGEKSFLAIGGDGTSWEIVNGLFPRVTNGAPPRLAQLPLGTGNSFLRDFGITDAAAAMRAIVQGRDRPCDVLRVKHQGGEIHAINIVGVGFTAEVGALTNRRYKPYGAAGYVMGVLQTAIDLKSPVYPLRLDGGSVDTRPALLLSFCNSRCTAGTMQMAPNAEVSDGELDVIRIAPRGRLSFFSQFPSIFAGTHVQRAGVEETRARRVELDLDRAIDTMIDGEVLSLALRSIEVVPSALRIVA